MSFFQAMDCPRPAWLGLEGLQGVVHGDPCAHHWASHFLSRFRQIPPAFTVPNMTKNMSKWRFCKMGVPPNHPILIVFFHYKPSIWGYPHSWRSPKSHHSHKWSQAAKHKIYLLIPVRCLKLDVAFAIGRIWWMSKHSKHGTWHPTTCLRFCRMPILWCIYDAVSTTHMLLLRM